jgi:hypothetical protein
VPIHWAPQPHAAHRSRESQRVVRRQSEAAPRLHRRGQTKPQIPMPVARPRPGQVRSRAGTGWEEDRMGGRRLPRRSVPRLPRIACTSKRPSVSDDDMPPDPVACGGTTSPGRTAGTPAWPGVRSLAASPDYPQPASCGPETSSSRPPTSAAAEPCASMGRITWAALRPHRAATPARHACPTRAKQLLTARPGCRGANACRQLGGRVTPGPARA